MTIKKLEFVCADICLSDYWGGHHKAHVQIPVYKGMTLKEIKREILSELSQGAVMGSDRLAYLLAADFVLPSEDGEATQAYKRALAAVNRLKPNVKGKRKFFTDLEEQTEDDATVYAFLIITEVE